MATNDRLMRYGEPPLVGIVIPVWNSREHTLACLESIYQLDYPSAVVTVVDNGSTDMTGAVLRERYPEIHRIRNDRNLGFARACNQGMEWVFSRGADYALLLNNDTTVDTNMLARLVDAALLYPDAGILGPKICYADRPGVPWFTGFRFRHGLYIVRTSSPRHLVQSACPAAVDFISGCGMLVSRRLYETIGGFHERYFMYYEDVDYCLTANKSGFDVLYIPHALMWHAISASSGGKHSVRKQIEQVKSCLIFSRRHTRGWTRLANVTVRISHALFVIARQSIGSAIDTLRGRSRERPPSPPSSVGRAMTRAGSEDRRR